MVEKERKDQQYGIDIVAAFAERTVKRLWITIILLVVLLFGSNAAWIVYESQFETVETEVTQEVEQENEDGYNSFVGGDYYGEAESSDYGQNEETRP